MKGSFTHETKKCLSAPLALHGEEPAPILEGCFHGALLLTEVPLAAEGAFSIASITSLEIPS